MDKVRVIQHSGFPMLWAIGWLFTIGYLKLSLFAGLLALFIWPYDIGTALSHLHP